MAQKMKVKITLTQGILGSANAVPEVHSEFIASKAPDAPSREEEVEALGVEEVEKKEMTVFPRNKEGQPVLWDYQVRGFFKHAAGMLKQADKKSLSAKVKSHKKFVDGMVFIEERQIPIVTDQEITSLQRPLRASTMQGERIALANSEFIQPGATAEFTIKTLNNDLCDTIEEWLDYGQYNGLGQWRNAGYGCFNWERLSQWEEC